MLRKKLEHCVNDWYARMQDVLEKFEQTGQAKA
jgi:predicted transcriptional regulator